MQYQLMFVFVFVLMLLSLLLLQAYRSIKGFSTFKHRDLEIPSAIGFSNARSLAQLYSALIEGSVCFPQIHLFAPLSTTMLTVLSLLRRPSLHTRHPIFQDKKVTQHALQCVAKGKDLINLMDSAFSRGGFQLDPSERCVIFSFLLLSSCNLCWFVLVLLFC